MCLQSCINGNYIGTFNLFRERTTHFLWICNAFEYCVCVWACVLHLYMKALRAIQAESVYSEVITFQYHWEIGNSSTVQSFWTSIHGSVIEFDIWSYELNTRGVINAQWTVSCNFRQSAAAAFTDTTQQKQQHAQIKSFRSFNFIREMSSFWLLTKLH